MENRNQSTKAIVEAGMISAVTVFITLLLIYTGFVSLYAICILPIPITILYLRQNIKITLISVLVSTILVALLYNPIEAVANTLIFGLVGLGLGFCLKKKYTVGKTIGIFGIIVSIASCLYLLIYLALITNLGITGAADEIAKQFNMSFGKYRPYIHSDFILKVMPGSIIVIGYLLAYLNYLVTKAVLKRLKYEVKDMVPFTKLYVPNKIGALMIIIFLFGEILSIKNIWIGECILISSGIVLLVMFLLQGISVASYFLMKQYNLSKSIVTLIIIIGLFLQAGVILSLIGLMDLVIDFRRVDPNRIFKK